MNPELGLVWFRIAIFVTLVSGAMLFFQKPGTSEFVINVASFAIGIIFITLIVLLIRRGN